MGETWWIIRLVNTSRYWNCVWIDRKDAHAFSDRDFAKDMIRRLRDSDGRVCKLVRVTVRRKP